MKAAQIVHEEKIAHPILLGRKDVIKSLMKDIDFDADIPIIDPKSDDEVERKNAYAQLYWKQRSRKRGLYAAKAKMRERNYFAAMMVNAGDADALISQDTQEVILQW